MGNLCAKRNRIKLKLQAVVYITPEKVSLTFDENNAERITIDFLDQKGWVRLGTTCQKEFVATFARGSECYEAIKQSSSYKIRYQIGKEGEESEWETYNPKKMVSSSDISKFSSDVKKLRESISNKGLPNGVNQINIAFVGITAAGKSSSIDTFKYSQTNSDASACAGMGIKQKGSYTLTQHELHPKIMIYDFFGWDLGQTVSSQNTFWDSMKGNYSKLHLLGPQLKSLMNSQELSVNVSQIKKENEVDINDQIHAYIFYFRHTEDADKLTESRTKFDEFRQEVQNAGFNPVIVIPHFDDYLKEKKVDLENLVGDVVTTSQIYKEYVNHYCTGSTKHVFGLVATSAFPGREYPESLKLLSLEILDKAMDQAITRIVDRRKLGLLPERTPER